MQATVPDCIQLFLLPTLTLPTSGEGIREGPQGGNIMIGGGEGLPGLRPSRRYAARAASRPSRSWSNPTVFDFLGFESTCI